MKKRIGILTAGGDCPGLNAAIRGVAFASYNLFDAEFVGINDGFSGLIEGNYTEMKPSDFPASSPSEEPSSAQDVRPTATCALSRKTTSIKSRK